MIVPIVERLLPLRIPAIKFSPVKLGHLTYGVYFAKTSMSKLLRWMF